MSHRDFCAMMGQGYIGEDEQGYVIFYGGAEKYRAWKPKKIFEESYRLILDEEKEIIKKMGA